MKAGDQSFLLGLLEQCSIFVSFARVGGFGVLLKRNREFHEVD